MHCVRVSVLVAFVALAFVGLFVTGGSTTRTSAQDATPAGMGGHPLVGTWLVDADADDPANPPEVDRFSADGGYVATGADGFTILGSWEATGERAAMATFVSTGVDDGGGYEGTFTIRATVEVDAAGDAFTAEYTIEIAGPDGTSMGEFGPGQATGTRITVEAMGTPVGPLSALFEEGGASTPEAGTPTA